MKIAFLYPSFESLGIESLSASLKLAGHETALFFEPGLFDDTFLHNRILAGMLSERGSLIRKLVGWEPDIVALSATSDIYPWALEIAEKLKRVFPVPIVMGGIHATSVPDVVIAERNIDYVIQGEGDQAIVDLVNCLDDGSDPKDIPNLWSKGNGEIRNMPPRPLVRDLDSLPFPDKTLYDDTFIKGLGVYTMLASRGCPYRCAYCNTGVIKDIYKAEKKSYWRPRSTDSVIEELKRAKKENRVGIINFCDELFGADIRWLREFSLRYRREIGKPFIAVAHPAHSNEEHVGLMKEAGCVKVDLGIQTTDPTIRKEVVKRHETNEQIAMAIDNYMKAGIRLYVEIIFNLPGQNEENSREMIRFFNERRPDFIKTYGLRIYPRTPIEYTLLEQGLITPEQVKRNATGKTAKSESFFLGGSLSDSSLSVFNSLLALIYMLPPRRVDYILEKRLYRLFPKSDYFAYFLNQLSRFMNDVSFDEDISKKCFARRYKFYLSQRIEALFR